jgi:hypothetical protein
MRHAQQRRPQSAPTKHERKRREEKIDATVDMTFPASDAPTAGRATSTEPPARPIDRKAPLITKEQIEAAATGGSASSQGSREHGNAREPRRRRRDR